MPAPLARGIIIAASVLIAAGIAAYESEDFRAWVERSREKIVLAFNSAGQEKSPPPSRRDDRSMREDTDEKAEERRRQAREEIMRRGRFMQDRMRVRKSSGESSSPIVDKKKSPSFDTLVDEEGNLRSDVEAVIATSSSVQVQDSDVALRSRSAKDTPHHSEPAPLLQAESDGPSANAIEPWESQYEREMRNTWNLPLPAVLTPTASTHASESLIDLTPTTEDFPDPDYSIPSDSEFDHPMERTDYFSAPSSGQSQTLSENTHSGHYYAHPSQPLQPLEPRPMIDEHDAVRSNSSAASVAGSQPSILMDNLDSDDSFSELGDGIRTPASVWTEVDSTTSDDQ